MAWAMLSAMLSMQRSFLKCSVLMMVHFFCYKILRIVIRNAIRSPLWRTTEETAAKCLSIRDSWGSSSRLLCFSYTLKYASDQVSPFMLFCIALIQSSVLYAYNYCSFLFLKKLLFSILWHLQISLISSRPRKSINTHALKAPFYF